MEVMMPKTYPRIVFVLLGLMLAGAACRSTGMEIPSSAETTIREDYIEWVYTQKLAGACEELPVVKVEWIAPRGITGKHPVVWLKTGDQFAAILRLANTQAEWIGGSVSAQPVMLLRDVPLYRLCRFSNVTPW
jgi:hypothetical protein